MTPRVALVHEWLVGWGGSESVLLSLARLFPDAPIYTSVWAPDGKTRSVFEGRTIRPTFLQHVPGRRRAYRHLLPLMPAAFERLDLSGHDLVVSSSHAFSKAVQVAPGADHVCYCHTPPRYIWDLAAQYRRGLGALAFRGPGLRWLRARDRAAARRVGHFVANSEHVARRIDRIYDRTAVVIHPPVDLPDEIPSGLHRPPRKDFVAGGRLVAYKRIDLAVAAANRLGVPLVVFGKGPEERRLRAMAGPTVRFAGVPSDDELRTLLSSARAFLFPGEEDFGILPVEAQAAGTAVIALGAGGARETVVEGQTGTFFAEPTTESLADVLRSFDPDDCSPDACRANAARFARPRFEEKMRQFLRTIGIVLALLIALPGAASGQQQILLQPGDMLRVEIWREEDLSGEFQVDESGMLTLPLVGRYEVAGEPWSETRETLMAAYQAELRNPSIVLTPLRRIYVLGHVMEPGLYPVDPTLSLAGTVAMAGGAGPEGDLSRLRVVREGETILDDVPVESALAAADVRSGDQIFVGRRSWFERNTTFLISMALSTTSIIATILTR